MPRRVPERGYEPENGACYEICHNNPKQAPEGKMIVDLCIPVKTA